MQKTSRREGSKSEAKNRVGTRFPVLSVHFLQRAGRTNNQARQKFNLALLVVEKAQLDVL